VRGTDYRQAPIAGSDIEAHLAAVADAEKDAGRRPILLLQQRRIVERVRPKRDPAFHREGPGESRYS
jgi:hypothetical protein